MRNVVIAALLLSCTLGTAANAQQFTMKISSPTINDVTQEWAEEFAAGLKARVGDKIKVEFYPASQLGQIPATVEGVAMTMIGTDPSRFSSESSRSNPSSPEVVSRE